MGKVLVTESHLLDIANAIRGKNGLANLYKLSEMSDAINAISTGGVELPNYRKYTVTVSSDIIGGTQKVLLITDSVIAEHYTDDSFKIEVRMTPASTQTYTITEVTGYNIPAQEPYRTGALSTTHQYTTRIGGTTGVVSPNVINYAVKDTDLTNLVGRLTANSSGNIYVMTGSSNYAIRAGTYVVEIFW